MKPDEKPLNLEQAQRRLMKRLKEDEPEKDLILLDEKTQQHAFGWIFYYTTRKHAESGDDRDAVPGSGPVIVERANGEITFLPTHRPPAILIKDWIEKWKEAQK